MNDLYIEWKYNGETILKTKESDYYYGMNDVKVWQEGKKVCLAISPKPNNPVKCLTIELVKGIDKLEVWTSKGKENIIKLL
jgi:hypothetical protein